MTEIEELVKLILPALKEFFNTQNISDNKQKQLDKVQNPSIACIKEDIENDWAKIGKIEHFNTWRGSANVSGIF